MLWVALYEAIVNKQYRLLQKGRTVRTLLTQACPGKHFGEYVQLILAKYLSVLFQQQVCDQA